MAAYELGLVPPEKFIRIAENSGLIISIGGWVLRTVFSGQEMAIDDVGICNSSFSYLKQFPVGTLKIDRSFIRDIAMNPDNAAITKAHQHGKEAQSQGNSRGGGKRSANVIPLRTSLSGNPRLLLQQGSNR